jgi:hypothetical protein
MEKPEEKEEKIEDIVQKIINGQITEIKEETKKEKISISFNKISSLNINEFQLNISIPDTSSQEHLEFIVEFNLIYNKIHLYSINIKELSDCRDLYPDIMQTLNDNFQKDKFDLKTLIKNLKNFVQNLPNILKDSKKVGKFYLAEEYDIITIKSLKNIIQIPCRRVEFIKGKKMKTPSLCCISADFFCLYEYGNASNKFLSNDEYKFTLVFYSSIDALIKFKKLFEGPAISLFFKKSDEKNEFYLKLESDIDKDINTIENILIEKIKASGVKLNIEEKKYGEVPNINIKEIEQKISEYELELQKSGNKELFNNLLGNYEQAIVYYSAINDKQYVTYSTRVKELLKNEKYAKYLS